jgi:hypothetical protein
MNYSSAIPLVGRHACPHRVDADGAGLRTKTQSKARPERCVSRSRNSSLSDITNRLSFGVESFPRFGTHAVQPFTDSFAA